MCGLTSRIAAPCGPWRSTAALGHVRFPGRSGAMPGMTSDTLEILARLERLTTTLGQIELRLGALERTRRELGGTKELLSLRESAKRLGISRGTTLRDLILDKRIRLVHIGNSVRIPVSEIARVIKELR